MELSKPVIAQWSRRILPVLLGAIGGYAYYSFIGCVSGTCPITGNPWTSTAYGAVIGFFLIPAVKKPIQGQ
ncbi:MAG: hypothetical protein HRF44_10780 [Ignavibacterium sp.]|jgi:hypothetical protein